MTEFERKVWEKLNHLENEVERLKSEKSAADKAIEFERLPDSAVVGKDYIAYRFGCSENSVMRREAGTNKIRRVSNKPIKAIKREVDAAWREHTRPTKEKAVEARADARPIKRRRSLITKQISA
jgi:hypothetical protein